MIQISTSTRLPTIALWRWDSPATQEKIGTTSHVVESNGSGDVSNACNLPPGALIEFGCGTGSNVPFLIELAGATSVVGIDTSESRLRSPGTNWDHRKRSSWLSEYEAPGKTDLVFCNGVFHHIPPADRATAVSTYIAA